MCLFEYVCLQIIRRKSKVFSKNLSIDNYCYLSFVFLSCIVEKKKSKNFLFTVLATHLFDKSSIQHFFVRRFYGLNIR